MGNALSQFWFNPEPTLTEKNAPDQTGRVFIVTGGYVGVGFELAKILYGLNATVWVAGRSESKAQAALSRLRESSPSSKGRVEFLKLDLADHTTIKPAVELFTAREQRLDVLVNNAGVMYPPAGSTDAHGTELQISTNCLGHYLLYQLLSPMLTATAAKAPTASVRVLWAASIAVDVACPSPGGIILNAPGNPDSSGRPTDQGVGMNYGQSKVGNVFFARELAKTTPATGVVHAAFNPGNLRTELQRNFPGIGGWLTDKLLLYPAVFGGYTELWAALTPELTPAKSGAYVWPWGRFGELPAGVERAMKKESEGGTGVADRFCEWCASETAAFM